MLESNAARATFFVITDRIPGNEALVKRIVESGHELGNHLTQDEPSVDLDPETFERELVRSHEALSAYASPRWFRPGSGWHDDRMLEVLERHGYRMALASDYPLDAHIPWSGFARRFLLWRAKPGAVMLLHDAEGRGERTAETLAAVLPELRRRGYRVVSLSELVALADRSQEDPRDATSEEERRAETP